MIFDNYPGGNEEASMADEETEMALEEATMSDREKTAWLALIAMAVTFGPYFALVASGALPREALPNLRQLVLFGVVALANGLVVGIGYLSQ